MLTHTCLQKPLREIEVAVCNHQTDSSFYVQAGVWSGDLQHEIEYDYTWHWMS